MFFLYLVDWKMHCHIFIFKADIQVWPFLWWCIKSSSMFFFRWLENILLDLIRSESIHTDLYIHSICNQTHNKTIVKNRSFIVCWYPSLYLININTISQVTKIHKESHMTSTITWRLTDVMRSFCSERGSINIAGTLIG